MSPEKVDLLDLSCPKCGHKFHIQMSKIDPKKVIVCKNCGATINFTGDWQKIGKALIKLDQAFNLP